MTNSQKSGGEIERHLMASIQFRGHPTLFKVQLQFVLQRRKKPYFTFTTPFLSSRLIV